MLGQARGCESNPPRSAPSAAIRTHHARAHAGRLTRACLSSRDSRTAQYAARAGSSISVTQLPTALRLVNERLLPALLPAIGDAFPTAFRDVSSLRLQEARLVKYNASAGMLHGF